MQRQQLEQGMQQVRQLGEGLKALAASYPMVAEEAQQIQTLLKSMVIKIAQGSPQQTMSSAMVPGNGGGA